MAEIYRLYTEADYDAATKITGTGQSQAWDNAYGIAGTVGSIKFTSASPPSGVYAEVDYDEITSTAFSYRFHVDSSNITLPASGNFIYLCRAQHGNVSVPGRSQLYLYNASGTLRLYQGLFNDSSSASYANYDISDALEYIEVKVFKSSSAMVNDAYQQVWVNGVLRTTVSNVVLYNGFNYDSLRLGIWSQSGSNTGDLYLGRVLITDDATPIGPYVPGSPLTYLRRRRRD